MHNLSDEALCGRWVENPYFQWCSGTSFRLIARHWLGELVAGWVRSSLPPCQRTRRNSRVSINSSGQAVDYRRNTRLRPLASRASAAGSSFRN